MQEHCDLCNLKDIRNNKNVNKHAHTNQLVYCVNINSCKVVFYVKILKKSKKKIKRRHVHSLSSTCSLTNYCFKPLCSEKRREHRDIFDFKIYYYLFSNNVWSRYLPEIKILNAMTHDRRKILNEKWIYERCTKDWELVRNDNGY